MIWKLFPEVNSASSATVESSFRHHFFKQNEIQIQEFLAMKDHHQTTVTLKAIQWSEKFILNLSEHVFMQSEEPMLKRGLNFAVTNRVSNLDMVCAAESARFRLPPALGMEFFWRI
jgi:hypothetical protein